MQPPSALKSAPSRALARKRYWTLLVSLLMILVSVIAWRVYQGNAASSAQVQPSEVIWKYAELKAHLAQKYTIEGVGLTLLDCNQTQDLAKRVLEGASGGQAKAKKLTEYVASRRKAGALISGLVSEPREPVLAAPSYVSARLQKTSSVRLYPLEVAAWAVCALRSQGVRASVAAIRDVQDKAVPLDPTGHFGYYGVAIDPKSQGDKFTAAEVVDIYGDAARDVPLQNVRVMTDPQAIAAGISQSVMQTLLNEHDPQVVQGQIESAIKIDGGSAASHTVNAMVHFASGQTDVGLSELELALKLERDAARHNNLAQVYVAQQNFDQARTHVTQALKLKPNYGAAHGVLGSLKLAQGDGNGAREELTLAQKWGANPAAIARTWAMLYLNEGDTDKAVENAQRAVDLRPTDIQARLLLAQIYRQTADYDKMRAQAQAALAQVPASAQSRLRSIIEEMLGPTAFEGTEAEGAIATDGDVTLDPDNLPDVGDLDLQGSSLLKDEPKKEASKPEAGPKVMLSPQDKYKLRDSNADLQLDVKTP